MPGLTRITDVLEAVRDDGTLPSLIYSLALHAAVLLLALVLFAHGHALRAPIAPAIVVTDLVPLGEETVSPSADEKAVNPQERARESTGHPDATGIPVPNDHRAPSLPSHADVASEKSASTGAGESSIRRTPSSGDAQTAAGGDLNARLEALAQLREPPSRLTPDPRPQAGEGTSNVTAANDAARRGAHATYGIKDFIRAQIARHWYLDRASQAFTQAKAQGWIASLHMTLNSDGTIGSVEVAIPPAQRENQAFQTFANGARNAVLLSAPLEIPPGTYDEVKDIELELKADDAAR